DRQIDVAPLQRLQRVEGGGAAPLDRRAQLPRERLGQTDLRPARRTPAVPDDPGTMIDGGDAHPPGRLDAVERPVGVSPERNLVAGGQNQEEQRKHGRKLEPRDLWESQVSALWSNPDLRKRVEVPCRTSGGRRRSPGAQPVRHRRAPEREEHPSWSTPESGR